MPDLKKDLKIEVAPEDHPIMHAESLSSGVVILFQDGKHAFYPSSLLYAMLPQAREIVIEDDDEGSSNSRS